MTPWCLPTHQLGQTPQLCRSSRRKHRRRCCPSLHKAGALFLWLPSSPRSSTAYSLQSLRREGKNEMLLCARFNKCLKWGRKQWVNGAWMQRWLECNWKSLEPQSVVSQGLELGAHQMICKGSPRRTSFLQPNGFVWLSCAGKTMCWQERQRSPVGLSIFTT